MNVSTIRIHNFSNEISCTKQIPIEYKLENTAHFRIGFIRQDNIITQYSSETKECKRSLIVKDSNETSYMIKKINPHIFIDKLDHHLTDFRLNVGQSKDLFNHHSYLLNGSDIFEQINEFMFSDSKLEVSFLGDSRSIKKNTHSDETTNFTLQNPFETISKTISTGFHNFFYYIKKKLTDLILIIFFLFSTFLIIYFLFTFYLKSKKRTSNIEFI